MELLREAKAKVCVYICVCACVCVCACTLLYFSPWSPTQPLLLYSFPRASTYVLALRIYSLPIPCYCYIQHILTMSTRAVCYPSSSVPAALPSAPCAPQYCTKELTPKYQSQLTPKPKPEPKKETKETKPAEGEVEGAAAVVKEGGEQKKEEGEAQAVAEVTKEEPKGQSCHGVGLLCDDDVRPMAVSVTTVTMSCGWREGLYSLGGCLA